MDPISVHFHEIALKGGNRAQFELRLRENIRAAVAPLGKLRVLPLTGGILVEGEAEDEGGEVLRRVASQFGVAYAMRTRSLPRELEAVGRAVVELVESRAPKSFRISARRRDKAYELTSVELNRRLGAEVHLKTGLPVSLKEAELDVPVLVLRDSILVGTQRVEGPGGLPVGTGGRVAVLLSGGIDSPVAAWRMMKRGCHVDLVHFHSFPRVDRASIEKAQDLAELLTRWQFSTRLHLVPLAEIQAQVRLHAPAPLRVILYRRFMVRLAERIARRQRCRALATGESLGQVASQTLQNLVAVDAAATMPLLRPLIAMDKQEIITDAQRIGSFPISIQPDQDCCQLFLPPKPALYATIDECLEAEKALEVDALIKDALARTEKLTFRWPPEAQREAGT